MPLDYPRTIGLPHSSWLYTDSLTSTCTRWLTSTHLENNRFMANVSAVHSFIPGMANVPKTKLKSWSERKIYFCFPFENKIMIQINFCLCFGNKVKIKIYFCFNFGNSYLRSKFNFEKPKPKFNLTMGLSPFLLIFFIKLNHKNP